MNTFRSLIVLLCLGTATLLAGCDSASTPELQVGPWTPDLSVHLDQLTLYVAHQQKECEGVGPQLCLLVKEKPEHDWQFFYRSINGFTYEAGFTYKLLVGLKHIEAPPADGSSIEWMLIDIVEKVQVK